MTDSNKERDFSPPNIDKTYNMTENGIDDGIESDILPQSRGSDDSIDTDIFSDTRVIFQDLVVESKSKYKTCAEVTNIIKVLTYWDTGNSEFPDVSEFRKAIKKGY